MAAPLLVSLAFDSDTNDVLETAATLALRMDVPLATIHALGWRPLESDAHLEKRVAETRERMLAHLAPAMDAGVEVLEPIVRRGRPNEVVAETASAIGAQMIVTGGGGPATAKRWLLGSVAESIVRASHLPVFLARGALPKQTMPVLCPIDLSPHSRAGLLAAVRMARLFECPLVTLTVVPEDDSGWLSLSDIEHAVASNEATVREQIGAFVETVDFEGVEVDHRVVMGEAVERILEESDRAWLLVMASRSFEELLPGAIGGVTERALRMSRCSALALRQSETEAARREEAIRKLGDLMAQADQHLEDGEPERALPILQLAVTRAPVNPVVQERLATALDALGRKDEAEGRRKLAGLIREQFR